MKKLNHLVLISAFISLNAFAQVAPAPSCNADEARRISAETERAVLDRVRADMRAEGRASAMGLGVNDQDCLNNAYQKANWIAQNAINDCQRQTTYFRTCAIQGQRVVGAPSRIQPMQGTGHVDEKEIAENACRAGAQSRAQQSAMEVCQRTFGIACRIVAVGEASHRIEQRRRYGLFGPKEDWHICDAAAQALPDTPQQVQCSVEIFARVQF